MGNSYYREPLVGGDEGAWGPYDQAQNRNGYGAISSELYNDSGTLKLTKGMIGFNNGTNRGVCLIDTVTSIDISGVASGNWGQIEVALSATVPVFTATTITGATTQCTLPTNFTNAFNPEQQGYYMTATKRCIGLIWKTAGGALGPIVNVVPFSDHCVISPIDISEDTTVENLKGDMIINVTSGTGTKKITLGSNNENWKITVKKVDSGYGPVMVSGTINNLSNVFLHTQYDTLRLITNTSDYAIINGFRPYYFSGWVPNSDWTNRHLGFITLTYDNGSGTFQIGDKVTGANGSYGICIFQNATTLVLVSLTAVGANIFSDNEALTGDRSGATALVNMAAHAKNADCLVYHGWGIAVEKIFKEMFYSSDKTEANKIQIYPQYTQISAQDYGCKILGIDTNNFKFQTATGGFVYVADNGGSAAIASNDAYYNSFIRLLSW